MTEATPSAANRALMDYRQADMDGVMVTVSRQAIHECNDEIADLKAENACLASYAKRASDALLKVRPLGGSEMFIRVGTNEGRYEYRADPDLCAREISKSIQDVVTLRVENASIRAALIADNDRLKDLCARLRQEAQFHAGEARGANATIREAYQEATGATGEPGNWHGAEPIKTALEKIRTERDELLQSFHQIKAVCEDNFADACNHKAALKFVESVIHTALAKVKS